MDFSLTSADGSSFFFAVLIFTVTKNVVGFEVLIDTNPPVLEFGDSLKINCSTTCAFPKPLITVEYKSGTDPIRNSSDNWIADFFPSVKAWDISVPCYVNCKGAKTANKVITVYNREISITSPPEVLEANRAYSLECIGPRVYPNNKLILTWLRGSEIVQSNSTGEQGYPDEDKRLRNVFSFTASVSDDGQVYTCLAEVDSGSSDRKLIANSSVTLQTCSFMDPPRILDKRPIEVKRETTLTCEVSNVYPAEKMRVRWSQDGKELNSTTTRPNSNTVRETAAWTPQVSGLTEVVCTADFEEYPSVPPKNNTIFIMVYVFSEPEIQVPVTLVGNRVNITCSVFNVSGQLQLRLKNGSDVLVNELSNTGLTIYHTLDVQAQLDKQQYICEAEMKLQVQPMTSSIVKKQVITLQVLSKPGDTTISVNNKTVSGFPVNVSKGDEVTLICNSNGNPTPTLKWEDPGNGSNVEIAPPGILRISHTTSGHQGIYKCTATNPYGIDEKEVDIRVTGETCIPGVVMAGILSFIIITAFILYWKCRGHKRGLYKVYKAKPNNNPQIPNGSEHLELDPYPDGKTTNGFYK
ncbi:intercellular adhesion molecule 1-like [Mustelus asterias]